jgi:hypothetical protein
MVTVVVVLLKIVCVLQVGWRFLWFDTKAVAHQSIRDWKGGVGIIFMAGSSFIFETIF